jgi:hypothetical protein
MTRDLFGDAPARTDAERQRAQRKLTNRPRGHYAPPGTGPNGEGANRSYWKCQRARLRWSRSIKTDIRLKDAACVGWEQAELLE